MKIQNMKANWSDFSQLAHITTQVWDVDPEIKYAYNFVDRL